MRLHVDIDGRTLTFDVKKNRNQRRIYIKPFRRLHYQVSAPIFADREMIERAVKAQAASILRLPSLLDPKERLLEDEIHLYGEPFPVFIREGRPRRVEKHGDSLVLYSRDQSPQKRIEAMRRFLRDTLLKDARALYEHYAERVPELSEFSVRFKAQYMKSKFGSCIPKKAHINLNLVLIHYPGRFLAYIVAHELAHLLEANHSRAFYRVLKTLCPDHQSLYRELERRHADYVTIAHDKTPAL